MPYIRQHGRQLVLVHGARNATTGQVEQRTLFTLHSKPEALEAIGKGKAENAQLFRSLIEAQYPDLKFRWSEIDRTIKEKLQILPDTYEYGAERLRAKFRATLCAFAAQIARADPQSLVSAAQIIRDHRHELEWLGDLIKWRLKLADAKPNKWNGDNEYFWRFVLRGSDVPSDALEHAASLYEKGKHDQAAALFRLFLDTFGEDADAHNFLGLIAIEKGRLNDATAEFRKTIELGRRSFPKRIRKNKFQDDFRLRPYLRGLNNLAMALNLNGDFKESLALLDRLETECGDEFSANSWRAIVFLNTGKWAEATRAARGFEVAPAESLAASLALHELGRTVESVAHALHAAMNLPRASRLVHSLPADKPTSAKEAEDWNQGIHLRRDLHAYLKRRTRTNRDFFTSLLNDPRVLALQREVQTAEAAWKKGDKSGLERMIRLRSIGFAREASLKVLVGHSRRGSDGTDSSRN